jgi:hypothetical protein
MNSYDDNDAKRKKAKEGIHVLAWWTPLLHFLFYWVGW